MRVDQPFRIANVTVVDPRDGSRSRKDVHVGNGKITRIAEPTRADADAIDGAGQFLVPGFVDMHGHALNLPDPADALLLMLAFGITGHRQMSGTDALLERRRAGTLARSRREPALLSLAGDLLTPMNASTPAKAVAEVARQARVGADFVKAALVTPEVCTAAQAEARRAGIPLLGHLPTGCDVRKTSRDGFRSVEHVGPGLGVIAGCSREEARVLAGIPAAPKIPTWPFKLPFMARLFERVLAKIVLNPAQITKPAELDNMKLALETFDEDRARELARQFVRDETWQCPTLIRMKAQELCDRDDFRRDPDLRFMHAEVRKTWNDAADRFAKKFSSVERAIFAAQFAMQEKLVGIFAQEGVGILAGSDTVGAVWVVPGASLHHELDLLAESGLSPLQVLQATTLNPARFLGRQELAGTVDVGKEADLVLLGADPMESVANLHAVVGVVRRGDHHAHADLEAMKDEVASRGVGHVQSRCCANHA